MTNPKNAKYALALLLLAAVCPNITHAEESDENTDNFSPVNHNAESTDKFNLGIVTRFHLGTMYVFRGQNVFSTNDAHKHYGLFEPFLKWNILHTGFTISYLGRYQINGENVDYNVDSGIGNEQNIIVGYERYFWERRINVYGQVSYIFYPFCMKEMTGVYNPSYWDTAIGAVAILYKKLYTGLNINYYSDLIEGYEKQYLYTDVFVRAELRPTHVMGIVGQISAGFRSFSKGNDAENIPDYNIKFDVGFPFFISDTLRIEPTVYLAHTQYFVTDYYRHMVWFGLDFKWDV